MSLRALRLNSSRGLSNTGSQVGPMSWSGVQGLKEEDRDIQSLPVRRTKLSPGQPRLYLASLQGTSVVH